MASKYWIKLYHEILHDPKMGKLPDGVWRRAIEMFLLAGELDDDGQLPPIADMAWTLRLDEGVLRKDLDALVEAEIVIETDGHWVVTHFATRQARVPGTQRVKQFRESQRKEEYYGERISNEDVTQRSTDKDTDKKRVDTDSDTYAPQDDIRTLEQLFVSETGIKCPTIRSPNSKAQEDYIDDWVTPFQRLLDQTDGNVILVEEAMREAYAKLKEKGLTVCAPRSIYKTALAQLTGTGNGDKKRPYSGTPTDLVAGMGYDPA